jgi:hypothetical protein
VKLSNTWYALILIASALLLNGVKTRSASAQSGSPPTRNEQQRQPTGQPSEASNSPPAPAAPEPSLTVPISAPQTSAAQTNPENWGQRLYHHIWPPLWKTFFPPIWSNWGLIIAASVAALVALKTLTAIDRGNMVNLRVARANRIAATAAKASSETAKSTMVIGHRAALGIKGVHFKLATNSTMIVFIENFGRIAASKLRIQIKTFRNTAPPDGVDWSKMMPSDDSRVMEGEIMPGVPHPIPITNAFLPDDQIQAIKSKLQYIYLSGRIVYDDGFGTDRTLLVRFSYDADSGNWLTVFV